MDPLYNYTPINKLVVAIFIVRKKRNNSIRIKMSPKINLLQWQIFKKQE